MRDQFSSQKETSEIKDRKKTAEQETLEKRTEPAVREFPSLKKIAFHMLNTFWFWSVVLLILLACSLCLGSSAITLPDLISALFHPGSSGYSILVHVRLPRTFGCLVTGSALACAGMIMQSILANPLASPSSVGLQAGAGFGMALVSALLPMSASLSIPAAFGGACLCAFFIMLLCWKKKASRSTLILAGLAISQIFSAGIDLIITLSDDALLGYTDFKIGSLSGLSLQQLLPAAILCAILLLAAWGCMRQMEVLSLGRSEAMSLGLSVTFWMVVFLGLACGLSAAVISMAGMISFIGLMIPHLVKATMDGSLQRQFGGCMLQGAAFMLFCDLIARTLFAPFEIPTGIVLSLFGGPYFLYLLFHLHKTSR